MSKQFESKVDEIRNRFVMRTAGEAPRLQSLAALLETSTPRPAIDAIRRMGHSIAGAAGTFRLDGLAKAADAVEAEAAALQQSGGTDTHLLRELCKGLLSEIQSLSERAAKERAGP